MADPLSVTASVIGIVGPALHGVCLLANDLEQIKDAPKNIASLKERIGFIEEGLVTLKNVGDKDFSALGITENAKSTINKCGEVCTGYSENIQHWTRHSEGDSLTLLDRSNIGFLKQKRIISMEKELQYYQGAITQVVSIATLISSLRHTHLTKEIQEKKEREVAVAIETTESESAELALRKREIRDRGPEIEGQDEEEEFDLVSSQVRKEEKSLKLSQSLLKALLAKIQEPSISQIAMKMQVQQDQPVYNISFGNNNHNDGVQVGVSHGQITFNGRSR